MLADVTSSTKPKLHNVSQRRQRRIEIQPRAISSYNLVKFGYVVFEICLRTTDVLLHSPIWNKVKLAVTPHSIVRYKLLLLLLLLLLPFYGPLDFVRDYPGEPVLER